MGLLPAVLHFGTEFPGKLVSVAFIFIRKRAALFIQKNGAVFHKKSRKGHELAVVFGDEDTLLGFGVIPVDHPTAPVHLGIDPTFHAHLRGDKDASEPTTLCV